MKEKKARVEDALHATRAAVEEGMLPGGGVAYIRIMGKLTSTICDNEDQKQGVKIVLKALEEPVKQIAVNAGLEGAVIVQNVINADPEVGFDAYKEEYVNMIDAGIVDPTKVTRSALQNSS